MNKIISVFLSAFILAACAAWPPAASADVKNVLIMGGDNDRHTVWSHSRIFKSVVGALTNKMHDAGFNVFDETAVTLGTSAQGRARRTDAEIIGVARGVKVLPLDAIVIFSIYPRDDRLQYTRKVWARITGRILNIRTSQKLGNFEVKSPEALRVTLDCNDDCLIESVTEETKLLAQDLGAVLVVKMKSLLRSESTPATTGGAPSAVLPNSFVLIFNNFTSDEMLRVEEYLASFSGYTGHRPIRETATHHEIWYETTAKSARLLRNLKKMLDHIDPKGRVETRIVHPRNSNRIMVEKITMR